MSSWEVFESIFSDKVFSTRSEVHCLACSEDFVCAGLRSGEVFVVDSNTDDNFTLPASSLPINCLKLKADRLIIGGQDARLSVWNLSNRSQESQIPAHEGVILAIDSAETRVYSSGIDCTVKLWDLAEVSKINEANFGSVICCIKVAERQVLLGNEIGDIEVTSLGLERIRVLSGHLDSVWCVDVMGEVVASCGYDGTLRLWDTSGAGGAVLGEHEGVVNKVLVIDPSALGIPMIVSVGSDALVKVWSLECLKDQWAYHTAPVTSLAYIDMFIVTAGCDNRIRLWSLMNRLRLKIAYKHKVAVSDYCVYKGRVIVIQEERLFSDKMEIKAEFGVNAFCKEPKEEVLVVSGESVVRMFDVAKGCEVKRIEVGENFTAIRCNERIILGCAESGIWRIEKESEKSSRFDIRAHCIDLCSMYIIISGENTSLLDLNMEGKEDIQVRFEAVLFSRNEKYFYGSDESGVRVYAVDGMKSLMSIQMFRVLKQLKLLENGGISACDGSEVLIMPEYDVEKEIMFPEG